MTLCGALPPPGPVVTGGVPGAAPVTGPPAATPPAPAGVTGIAAAPTAAAAGAASSATWVGPSTVSEGRAVLHHEVGHGVA